MPTNTAAWQPIKRGSLQVKSAPYTSPKASEIVVKNRALAINPVDWVLQIAGSVAFPWIKYPFILGEDVAGVVVEIGTSVTRFSVGDRVLGYAVGTDKDVNSATQGAFQEYTVLRENLACPIPDSLPFERAVVLPLAISTAACGLFQKDHLALEYPSANPKPTGKTILIWGGSTSVGSNAIQLAVAAGYDVATTASPSNFDYVKKLGARYVFDYKSPTVEEDILSALKGVECAGALNIGKNSARSCANIVSALGGKKFVSNASAAVSLEKGMTPSVMLSFISNTVSERISFAAKGVGSKMIFGSTLKANEVSKVIFEDFLPKALVNGQYLVAPDPQVIGKGLEFVQAGFDVQRNGVSAKKIVVSL